jgi:hypothetical protein
MEVKKNQKGTLDAGKCPCRKMTMFAHVKSLGKFLHEQKPRQNTQYAKYYSQAITIFRKLSSVSKFYLKIDFVEYRCDRSRGNKTWEAHTFLYRLIWLQFLSLREVPFS